MPRAALERRKRRRFTVSRIAEKKRGKRIERGMEKENYRDALDERENTVKPGDNAIDRDKSEILPMHRKNGNAPGQPDKSGGTGEHRDLCDDKRTYC